MAKCYCLLLLVTLVALCVFITLGRAGDVGYSRASRPGVAGAEPLNIGQAATLSGCDAVVANITNLCRDFVVGDAPPSPGPGSPCCKTLRGNRPNLSCLCGRVDFPKLNQKNLVLTSLLCAVPFSFEKCPSH